ncbi:MAG: lactamase [Chloroflexi bacterium]|nr:MAG: lactamase [Chloroflexota bacterium]MBL1194504.1 lactamase [Chloroflexota bacterium]NOH11792.1 MBL fold metallo-hydrolase [Chloroflexota bacterium]
MEITWYGHSCFRITERNMASVVTDPYDHSEVGYAALKLKSDIVTMSQDDPAHNFAKGVKGASWEINGPGEYEIGGVFLTAVASGNDKKNGARNLVCVLDYNGVTVAHLGNLSTVPSKAQIEALGSVQVALVPVGGGASLNAAKAAEVISLIEPGIVVPMHYLTPKSKTKLNKIDQFLKEMGVGKKVDTEDSLKVTSSSVPEETRVVVLNPAV